jgi:hypothetical protein
MLVTRLQTCDAAACREAASVSSKFGCSGDAVIQQPLPIVLVHPGARHDGGPHEVPPKALQPLDARCDVGRSEDALADGHLRCQGRTPITEST